MNFKEQIQNKANELYPQRIYVDSFGEYQDTNIKERDIWLSGAEFAYKTVLSSDVVKGLVEALENLLAHNADLLRTVKNHGAFVNTWLNGIESAHYNANKILTNFKQEVKQ